MPPTVPGPRAPHAYAERLSRSADSREFHQFYEDALGWPLTRGPADAPPRLATGVAFDVLGLPAGAGLAVLGKAPSGPVALSADRTRMWFLVAAGTAEEVPGLLDWLEWGGIDLDLDALGAGCGVEAPAPPWRHARAVPGAAAWLRPPVALALPALRLCDGVAPGGGSGTATGTGGSGGGAPDLVRLVDTAAAECHRVRIARGPARTVAAGAHRQPLAFS
ncbi:SCO3374 family protein [Streptomyces sp. NRRL F-5126]|uniref:SCO3374 family protein n=1 Tax=Streptomyces sp. NRRL F-5126 TaxID=1463857 RepID=UPI0004C4A746|nr:SCO3374 family protein [Streptomyces sp. NRRL F-5126]